MDDVWNNQTRFGSIHEALNRIPHDQTALGLGFKLTHNPQSCVRCRAYIATLELHGIIRMLQEKDSLVVEGTETDGL